MAEAKLLLKRPITELYFDLDENSLEVTGYTKVIRCEKCKMWKEGYCYLNYGLPHTTDASDYCSWWEKKGAKNE